MDIKSLVLTFFLGVLLSTPNITSSVVAVCNERERKALITFKEDLKDPSNQLSSWDDGGNIKDCCRWTGVICNNKTETSIVQLHLQSLMLGGELNPSLLELKHLNHLDLSQNFFQGISIPAFLGSFQNLRYLNLASAGFVGMVPHQLGNLSSLRYLNINSGPSFDGDQNLGVDGDLEWLSHLSSLQYLHMAWVNLSKASSNWLHSINMLPSLLELHLPLCKLGSLPSLSYANLSSLEILDLSSNHISSDFPRWIYNLSSLEQLDIHSNNFRGTISVAAGELGSLTKLDLSYNKFEGEVLRTLGNLCNLQNLDFSSNKLYGDISVFFQNSSGCMTDSLESLNLGFNQLSGSIPLSLGRYSMLRQIDLRSNKLNGSLPKSLRHLSRLDYLRMSDNVLEGIVTEFHFANLSRLNILEMPSSLVLKLRPDWIPPFQLELAIFRTCHLGPRFPGWLRTQKNIMILDLSNNGISGIVPTWFWNMSSQFLSLNLSHNHFSGELPNLLISSATGQFYLSSNRFTGQLPLLSSNVLGLDLSNNSISGNISVLLCNTVNEMSLRFLVLSGNLLTGEFPDCWFYWKSLTLLLLESNKLEGTIPSSMGSLLDLKSLHLQNNSLSGELPSSLQNCTKLVAIDLGENRFTGSIPTWIGESLPKLIVLRLRLNKFYGGIPRDFCHLNSLQLLDLAHNNLSGSIPRCFSNFSAMVSKRNLSDYIFSSSFQNQGYVETASLVTKGREFEYSYTLALVTSIDLSSNNLSGEIPGELCSLFGLRSLNLSENHFTEKIPDKIGRMSLLESLDLSNNKLSGLIPQSMANLNFLSHLNLSYNNLSGEIPTSTQLHGFFDSYMGNPGLCGPPLLKKCNGDNIGQPQGPGEDEDEDWVEMKWFYVSLPLGFVTGFWGFLGVLLVKKSWRYAYFGFIADMIEKFCNCCSSSKFRLFR